MTDRSGKTLLTPSGGVQRARRPLLFLVGAGLLLMLWTATEYFRGNPGLIMHATPSRQSEAPAAQDTSGAVSTGASPASGTAATEAPQAAPTEGMVRLMQQLQANPNDLSALTALAEHFTHLQDWTRAETFALRALVAAPSDAKPLHLLGIIQHGQGRQTEATASLEKSLILGDDPAVRYSLGVLYAYYLNDPAKGKTQLLRSLQHPEASPSLKDHLKAELANLEKAEKNK